MENGLTDGVLHLDTGTGLPENLQYVYDVCEQFGWDLKVYSAKKTLYSFAEEYGFPQPASHSWAYRYFKEHTLDRVANDMVCEGKPEFYTGVRKDESDRRMRTISDERQERDRWVWASPIMDWSEEDCEAYIDEHELPKSPVVENIHRSGECYCGAFARRDEELIDLQAHYPEHANWLLDLEAEVQEEIGTDEEYCWWGAGGEPPENVESLMENGDHDSDMVLCKDCQLPQAEMPSEADD
jgi:3'-phosphoadenosine 5'-phosphosulfate sulfotransferase (PAPS reductase)/FAD synthetase